MRVCVNTQVIADNPVKICLQLFIMSTSTGLAHAFEKPKVGRLHSATYAARK